MPSALLFDIKRYALHDGPNIRTTIFFKGCPLNCFWCHNPEGIETAQRLVFLADRCIGCRECLVTCPESALTLDGQGIHRNEAACTLCLNCVEICPALAQEAVGWQADLGLIMTEIGKDMPFYDHSGGGVTFSGGEPLQQAEFLLAALRACGELGLHRAVDTSGCAPTAVLREVAAHTDLFLFDLKHMDSDLHRRHTGVANDLILANLTMLATTGIPIRIRIPLLAGINDDADNIRATAAFAAGLDSIEAIDLLPYHHIATGKYRKLAIAYSGLPSHVPSPESLKRACAILKSFGHEVSIGG